MYFQLICDFCFTIKLVCDKKKTNKKTTKLQRKFTKHVSSYAQNIFASTFPYKLNL